MRRLPIIGFVIYILGYARSDVIGSRTSFVIATVCFSITLNYMNLGVIHFMPTA